MLPQTATEERTSTSVQQPEEEQFTMETSKERIVRLETQIEFLHDDVKDLRNTVETKLDKIDGSLAELSKSHFVFDRKYIKYIIGVAAVMIGGSNASALLALL